MKKTANLLDAVEAALRKIGRPATSGEIANTIKSTASLRGHLNGATPNKTIQARVSTDIVANHEDSRFYRFAPSTFALRDLSQHYAPTYRRIYVGFDRRRQLDHTPILNVTRSSIPSFLDHGYFSEEHFPLRLLAHLQLFWLDPKLQIDSDLVEVCLFILLTNEGHVLTYEPSDFDLRHSTVVDTVSIGLNGRFRQDDRNLFDSTHVGFSFAVEREVYTFLSRFSRSLAHQQSRPAFMGFVRDEFAKERAKSFGVVAQVEIPRVEVHDHRLGFRNLNWRPMNTIPNDFVRFDSWSQFVLSGLNLD